MGCHVPRPSTAVIIFCRFRSGDTLAERIFFFPHAPWSDICNNDEILTLNGEKNRIVSKSMNVNVFSREGKKMWRPFTAPVFLVLPCGSKPADGSGSLQLLWA